MAIRPDYDIGEVTLSSGSADFTTTGSALQTAAVQAGDSIIAPSGHVLIIATITGQNSGTLFLPCPAAAAGTGLPLRIRFQPDGSRYQGAVRNLIDLLSSGNVEALAGLVGEAGKVPVFTGPGAMALQDYLADPNESLGKLAALTLGNRQILQTDAAGDLKQVALAANKALATDANGDVTPIDLGTLGRALLALASGTSAQYVQGDGTLQAKAGLPVSTATQTALDGKVSKTGDTLTGTASFNMASTGATAINAYCPRPNSDFNHAPAFVSRAGTSGQALYAGFHAMEAVGIGMRALIDVVGGATVATFTFTNAGGLTVPGALAKGSGTFLIDHPLDPFNKNLRHGFVEAPRYDLIYRGTVQLENGRATVDIDVASNMSTGTFAALTTNAVVTSLQNQDGFARLKPGSINGGSFDIICEDEACTDLVSWVVIAERNDPFVKSDLDQNTDGDGRFVPEFEKEDA